MISSGVAEVIITVVPPHDKATGWKPSVGIELSVPFVSQGAYVTFPLISPTTTPDALEPYQLHVAAITGAD